tara:strand:+ start:3518 stop:3772 length:255 start_codon:yes stop_codon:yes gene_type:complete
MNTTYCKEKIVSLKKIIKEKDEEIKHLKNELFLCEESKKKAGIISKGNMTATPVPKFSKPDMKKLLKGRAKALEAYAKKLNEDN